MTEVWKPVLGYEESYEVSDCGNLRRSFNRFGNPSGRPCRPSEVRGYLRYTLCFETVTQTHSAHRLVWEAFNGAIPDGLQINHKNGVRGDNRLENLETCTPAENTRHAHQVLGYVPRRLPPTIGSANARATITEAEVPEIRRLYAEGRTQKELAEQFGMKVGAVGCLVRGETWRHVD